MITHFLSFCYCCCFLGFLVFCFPWAIKLSATISFLAPHSNFLLLLSLQSGSSLLDYQPITWLLYVINYVMVSQPDLQNGSFGPSPPRRFSRCFFLPGLMLPCLSLPVFVLSVSFRASTGFVCWNLLSVSPQWRRSSRLCDDTQSCSMCSFIHIRVHTYFMSYIIWMTLFHLTDTISIHNSRVSESLNSCIHLYYYLTWDVYIMEYTDPIIMKHLWNSTLREQLIHFIFSIRPFTQTLWHKHINTHCALNKAWQYFIVVVSQQFTASPTKFWF